MHQTKKGNQWYFGMKAHIGVDAGSSMIHSIVATFASIHDVNVAPKLSVRMMMLSTAIPAIWVCPRDRKFNRKSINPKLTTASTGIHLRLRPMMPILASTGR